MNSGAISKDYGEEFFQMHVPWRADYNHVAEALADNLRFETVADLGCGNGFIIYRLQELGKKVIGIDGSDHAKPFASSIIRIADLSRRLHIGKHDLVICTEVAEHIHARHADRLIDNICRAARKLIFFSAATLGSGGYLHVNEQDKSYWLDKFLRYRFRLDDITTQSICNRLRANLQHTLWFAQNGMVIRRG